jgi:death-on-curing protein
LSDDSPNPAIDTIWFPSVDDVRQMHADMLDLLDEVSPAVDLSKLEGALHRPIWRMRYEGETDLVLIAAALAASLAQVHTFVDGNKRSVYAALALFLQVNGRRLTTEPGDISVAEWIERIVVDGHASQDVSERTQQAFAKYLRAVTIPH